MTSYLILKYLHLIGAAVLFGTGIGIAFFAWFGYRMAMKDKNLSLLHGVLKLTVIADTVFTATVALLQPITGLWLWHLSAHSWNHAWLKWVILAYVGVGLCWLPVVRLQMQLRDRALQVTDVRDLGDEFHHKFRLWFALGLPAFALMLVLFALMLARGYMM